MTDETKLGLLAGILAVIGVAVFSQPKTPPRDSNESSAQNTVITATSETPNPFKPR